MCHSALDFVRAFSPWERGRRLVTRYGVHWPSPYEAGKMWSVTKLPQQRGTPSSTDGAPLLFPVFPLALASSSFTSHKRRERNTKKEEKKQVFTPRAYLFLSSENVDLSSRFVDGTGSCLPSPPARGGGGQCPSSSFSVFPLQAILLAVDVWWVFLSLPLSLSPFNEAAQLIPQVSIFFIYHLQKSSRSLELRNVRTNFI